MKWKAANTVCTIMSLISAIKKKKVKSIKKFKTTTRSIWSKKWLLRRYSGRDLTSVVLDELRFEDPKGFQNFTRMSVTTFLELLDKVTPYIQKQDTVLRQAISPSTRLLVTLRFLATGARYTDLAYGFRTSAQAISVLVPETLKAIYLVLKDDFLKVPQSSSQWMEIAEGFEKKWNFPQCIGAIDGKHIAICSRKEYGSFYYNYKGFNSVILMAVVDANYKFLYVDVGTNGRANDAAAFNESSLCRGISENLFDFPQDKELPGTDQKVPYLFVADDAFRLTSRMLKPHGQRNSDYKKIFNYRLSRARRVVENAFGILANKFQVFQRDIDLPVDKVEIITLAACSLHNFIRTRDGFERGLLDTENTRSLTITNGSWRTNVFMTGIQRSQGNRSGDEGIRVRNIYTEYFNKIGFVPWQWEAIKKFNF